jgi:MSHA biogenesis protein MshP
MPRMSTTCPERGLASRPARRVAGGFTMVSALFILVVLAALGAALAKVSLRQHLGSAAEIEAARAYQGAKAGLEWGAFQVLRNPAPPAAAPACFAATSFNPPGGLSNFTVTVSCTRTPASGTVADGATALAFYQLVANACNAPSGGACPAGGTPRTTYVERQLSSTVMR